MREITQIKENRIKRKEIFDQLMNLHEQQHIVDDITDHFNNIEIVNYV